MNDELLYRLALPLVPQIGCVHANTLVQHFGSAKDIFLAKKKLLEKVDGIGEARARAIKEFSAFRLAEEEILFIGKYKITPLFLTDATYPKRLLNCYDPPTVLYYRGETDLNCVKVIAVVGTRNHSDYGKQMTEKLIEELAPYQVLITSGLAFGIDAIAHKTALKYQLPTVGVLAHGLEKIYPPAHTGLAREMVNSNGGLLTEFHSRVKPDKHNFPTRNRIVAGMSDATVIIETGMKGGSMITAELANSYHRDVLAFPGKVTDAKSEGCNYLVKSNKAILVTGGLDLAQTLGWQQRNKSAAPIQQQLFLQLSENERKIATCISEKESMHIDELSNKCNLPLSIIASCILNLELSGMIRSLPGKQYRLN